MNIQLTISMLVSDRMETLGKCLSSLKPFLRELDSELIVVFTGENQETLDFIRQYTSHIIHFDWCNDFSKARNAGLREAKGEWLLYIDDDEWFENPREIIQFFKSGEYQHYGSALYIQRNYLDFEGKRFSDGNVGRMCRLTPETEFVFPIHENLVPFEEPCKRFTAFVHHFGYARKEKLGQEDTKTSRNLPLLLEMYKKDPDSPQCCMQIAQEYRSVFEFGKAVEYCRKGLALARKEKRIYNYELWLQANLPLLISYTGNLKLALKEGEEIIRHPRTLEAGELHLSVTLVSLCRKLKECRKGLKYVRLYHDKLSYLWRHPEKASVQSAAGLTFGQGEKEAVPVYVDGLFFASEVKDFQAARQILSWFPWENEALVAPHYPRLEEWKKGYDGQRDGILREYGRLDTANAYVRIQKMLLAESQGHLKETESLWNICAKDCPAGFQWELIETAVRNQFPLEPLMEKMQPEAWNSYAQMVTERKKWEELQTFCQNILPLLEAHPFYARKLEQYFLERRLTQELPKPTELAGTLRQYCMSVCRDAAALFRDEVLASPEAYALPSKYRFAMVIVEALAFIDEGRFTESFPIFEKAVRIYPQMSEAIGALLRYIEEQIQMPAVSEEFTLLGEQVKQILRGLMDSGQWTEAQGVMAQLLSLLPDDPEVLRMKQEILRQGT